MRRHLLVLMCVVLGGTGMMSAEAAQPFERYPRQPRSLPSPPGWFRVTRVDGRWWMLDPGGHRFISLGINNVSLSPDVIQGTNRSPYQEAVVAKYGRQSAWAEAVVQRLRGWGFNTLGAWSDRTVCEQGMPYTVMLDFSRQVDLGEEQTFPDVFAPAYRRGARSRAEAVCRPLSDDRMVVGYFTDNELRWGPDWRSEETLFVEYLRLGDSAPGRLALLRFLENRYLTIGELNQVWGTDYESFEEVGRTPQVGSRIPEVDESDFLRLIAQRYFWVAEEAIRAVDRRHLILGCRFAGYAPGPVLEGMGEHVDVVSVNHYEVHPPVDLLRRIHRTVGKPVLITEFGFRARDSGLPNSTGAGPVVDTQQERAEHFERYVEELMALPMVVGYHWFEHADQPAEGRFDGENSNYGVVNIADEPYAALVDTMTRVNGRMTVRANGRLGPLPQ